MKPFKCRYSMRLTWSVADDAYIARVRELPGCTADGLDPEQAVLNLELAIEQWIETAQKLGRDIPEPEVE